MNPFIKTIPFMVFAKFGVLMLLFGVLKYFEYIRIKSEHKLIINSSKILHSAIVLFMAVLGIGVVINNSIVILGEIV